MQRGMHSPASISTCNANADSDEKMQCTAGFSWNPSVVVGVCQALAQTLFGRLKCLHIVSGVVNILWEVCDDVCVKSVRGM